MTTTQPDCLCEFLMGVESYMINQLDKLLPNELVSALRQLAIVQGRRVYARHNQHLHPGEPTSTVPTAATERFRYYGN